MAQLSTFETWYGRDLPPPEVIQLRAGGLRLEFENGDLRYIRADQNEWVRRIYVAIRDANWNTIPAYISNLDVQAGSDRFRVQYDAFHQAGPLAFHWHADYVGFPDGRVEVTMDGAAETDFRYCRIGFCLLHPIQGIAGRPYRAVTPGGVIAGTLPEIVGPQKIVNGFEAPIFPSCSELSIDLGQGVLLTSEFEGDLFEMEDQRNWTDGSFKTYGTPLSLGYPHQARAGQTFHQKISLRATTPNPFSLYAAAASAPDPVVQLRVGEAAGMRLPAIGFGLPANREGLRPREIDLLAQLRPDHLKTSLNLGSPGWEIGLARALDTATNLQSSLELAVFLDDQPEAALQVLAGRLRGQPIERIIVFHQTEAPQGSTSARWMNLARAHLGHALPAVPLVGGTNGNFAELNRQPPDISVMDGVAYTINPQVHAFDERSLVEAVDAQRDTLTAARSYCASLPISISSVTLKPPFNQAANEPESPTDARRLPAAVDPRQMSLFAAAWTAGSIASLGLGGVESITYYETTGWQGLIETEAGSPLPDQFRSFPGMIYPVYWIFDFLSGARQAELLPVVSANPLQVGGLAFLKDGRLRLALANFQALDQAIQVASLPAGQGQMLRLNQDSFPTATMAPAAFRSHSEPHILYDRTLALTLRPYETAFIDLQVQM